ncbi:MAG: nuclear transport factor 2 family protein [Chthonomonas sp.]|nr:nuclear transport factor 2 family protein [Chthonomonas sp.]
MNKFILFLGLIAVTMIAFATPADDQAIKSAYAAMDQAIGRKDVATIRKYVTKDAVWSSKQTGKVKSEQALASLEQQLKAVQSMTMSTKIFSIKVTGATAVVKTAGSMKVKAMNPQTKKVMVIDAKSMGTDTWTKTAQGWKIKSVNTDSTEMFVDGKKIDMNAARAGAKGGAKPK